MGDLVLWSDLTAQTNFMLVLSSRATCIVKSQGPRLKVNNDHPKFVRQNMELSVSCSTIAKAIRTIRGFFTSANTFGFTGWVLNACVW